MAQRSSASFLLLLLLLAGGLAVLAARRDPAAAARPGPAGGTAMGEHADVVLHARDACLDAGYLCDSLAHADSFRILRWPDAVGALRVRVPLPPLADARRARDLQNGAVRGLLAWQDAPLRLEVTAGEEGAADIVVSWSGRMEGTRLGETRLEWREENGVVTFRVPTLALATVSPRDGAPFTGADVELIAVHEMGHALGLPHSDSPHDVMYPEKTARFLTTRDHRTVHALYGLPTGALVRR